MRLTQMKLTSRSISNADRFKTYGVVNLNTWIKTKQKLATSLLDYFIKTNHFSNIHRTLKKRTQILIKTDNNNVPSSRYLNSKLCPMGNRKQTYNNLNLNRFILSIL